MGDPLPFVQLPTSVIRDSGLTIVARLLYGVISTYADLSTREATLLRATLAKDIGKSRDTIDRGVTELVKAGLLKVSHRRNDKGVLIASTYTIVPPVTANAQVTGGRTDAHTPMGTDAPMGNVADTPMGTDAGMGVGAHTPVGTDADTVGAPMRPGYGHGCGKELEPLEREPRNDTNHAADAAPQRPRPKASNDKTPEARIANRYFDHTDGMCNWVAIQSIAKTSLRVRGATEQSIGDILCGLYDAGKPISLSLVGQVASGIVELDGRRKRKNSITDDNRVYVDDPDASFLGDRRTQR